MKRFALLLILNLSIFLPCDGYGKITVARIFSDNMVLQRETEIPVWGTADPGEVITVSLSRESVSVTTNVLGKWKVFLPQFEAGGPYRLKISGNKSTFVFENVLIGDVWFVSGQSNMEHPMKGWEFIPHSAVSDSEKEIADSNYPEIRLFQVPKYPSPIEQEDLHSGNWEVAGPQSVAGFSSTAWFFAKELYKKIKVPIGIIHSSWGGSSIQPWMSRKSLEPFKEQVKIPELPQTFDLREWTNKVSASLEKNLTRRNQISYPAPGLIEKYSNPDFDDSSWEAINLPNPQSKFGNILWLRKTVDIQGNLTNNDFELSLGFLNRQSQIFINGIEVGYFLYPQPAKAKITSSLLHPGENVITARVAQPFGNSLVMGGADQFWLKCPQRGFSFNLASDWKVNDQLEQVIPATESYQGNPTFLYNGMVTPVIPYALKGFIWYQGESNAGEPKLYEKLFQQLITDWRKLWNQGDLPFLFVQASNINLTHRFDQRDDSWCLLREAQQKALKLPMTGMVVSLDIGDRYDVHPKNKQEFGQRLVLQALKIAYNQNNTANGPFIESYHIKNDTVVLKPNEPISKREEMNTNNLTGFEIRNNGAFAQVKALLKDGYIQVLYPTRELPLELYYVWTNNPQCSIYNSSGLPMAPFRIVVR